MYVQRLEDEVARRLAARGISSNGGSLAPFNDFTRVADLIERLFPDRPKEKVC